MKDYSLRAHLDMLLSAPGELCEIHTPVDADAEIAGLYKLTGAGGTVKRPTGHGPALLFDNINGFPGKKVAIGILGTRERVARCLNTEASQLSWNLLDALKAPVKPVKIPRSDAVCQEEIHLASDPGFDLRKILPAPKNTERDAGPYITMGLVYVHDEESGEANISAHRLCIQNNTQMTIGVGGTRHLMSFMEKYFKQGKPAPISINIGVDPAIYVCASLQSPATPQGLDELSVAGALRDQPVELTDCVTIPEYAIANAEYVIEAEVHPVERMAEDSQTGSGFSLPEFCGYCGEARTFSVVNVKAVTHRKDPVMQICIGSSEEHVNMAGPAQEAAILEMTSRALPGIVKNVCCPASGGGKLMAVLQVRKSEPMDEGKQKQAALIAFGAYMELKNIFLVDEDVDPFDLSDVMWAFTTRFRPDRDLIEIPQVRCHKGDPTQKKIYDPGLPEEGLAVKCIYDCTVPAGSKKFFERPEFKQVNVKDYDFN